MQVAVVKATISMTTGQVLQREVVEHIEVDEDEHYRPLVEIFAKHVEKYIDQENQAR